MRVPPKPPLKAWLGLGAGLVLAGCAAGAPPPPDVAPGGSVARGAALAQARCASCHAVDRSDDSPMPGAPPFRRLSDNYPVANLQEGLAEGLVTAHPGMPQFAFEPDEIRDLIAYLETL